MGTQPSSDGARSPDGVPHTARWARSRAQTGLGAQTGFHLLRATDGYAAERLRGSEPGRGSIYCAQPMGTQPSADRARSPDGIPSTARCARSLAQTGLGPQSGFYLLHATDGYAAKLRRGSMPGRGSTYCAMGTQPSADGARSPDGVPSTVRHRWVRSRAQTGLGARTGFHILRDGHAAERRRGSEFGWGSTYCAMGTQPSSDGNRSADGIPPTARHLCARSDGVGCDGGRAGRSAERGQQRRGRGLKCRRQGTGGARRHPKALSRRELLKCRKTMRGEKGTTALTANERMRQSAWRASFFFGNFMFPITRATRRAKLSFCDFLLPLGFHFSLAPKQKPAFWCVRLSPLPLSCPHAPVSVSPTLAPHSRHARVSRYASLDRVRGVGSAGGLAER
jgi:hypothetical protein